MSNVDKYNEDIKRLKTELSETKKKYDSINSLLKQKQFELRRIVASIDRANKVIDRDIEICRRYVTKNPGCPSKNLVSHLNIEMHNMSKRWKYLDTNTFMGNMGMYLENSGLFTNEKTVIDGNYTNIWKLK